MFALPMYVASVKFHSISISLREGEGRGRVEPASRCVAARGGAGRMRGGMVYALIVVFVMLWIKRCRPDEGGRGVRTHYRLGGDWCVSERDQPFSPQPPCIVHCSGSQQTVKLKPWLVAHAGACTLQQGHP